jgi:predicted HAD superfamily Cof-like phosphohydrolase
MKRDFTSFTKMVNEVQEFQEVFDLIINHEPTAEVPETLYELRHRLMHEENEEYLEACREGNLTNIADALGDKLYILLGTIITHGMQHKIAEVFEEIHRSNMSKLDRDGKPIYREDGKIMKSDLYFKPDIQKILSSRQEDLKFI